MKYQIISESADNPNEIMVTEVNKAMFFGTVMQTADASDQDKEGTYFYRNHRLIGVVLND